MIISVPLEQEEHIILATNVVDSTDEFDNEVGVDIAIDKEFQQDDKIYQNITLEEIPVYNPYVPTNIYEVEDLVFTDDGLGVDRIHKITNTSGDAPQFPENYSTGYETTLDNNLWEDRYVQFGTYQEGVSFKGKSKIMDEYLDMSYLHDMEVSGDGTKFFVTYEDTIFMHIASEPWEVESLGVAQASYSIASGYIKALSFTKDGLHLFILNGGTGKVELYELSSAWSITSMSFINSVTHGVADTSAIRSRRALDGSEGNYFYISNRGNFSIHTFYMNTDWDIINASEQSSYILPEIDRYLMDFDFTDDGNKLIVADLFDMVEYTLPVAYDPNNAIFSYNAGGIIRSAFSHKLRISPNGENIYQLEASPYYPGIHQSALLTPNDISTYHFSVLPLDFRETRDGVDYRYYMYFNPLAQVYTFRSYRNDVYSTQIMTDLFINPLDPSLEEKAYIASNGTWLPKTIYKRPTALYIRTTTDAPPETRTVIDYSLEVVEHVKNIDGMVLIRPIVPYLPLDLKNYTFAETQGLMTYSIQGSSIFDTIALGKIKGDTITVTFYDATGIEVNSITQAINSTRDTHSHLPACHTTLIFYSTTPISPVLDEFGEWQYGAVTIKIETNDLSDYIRLSTLLLGISAEAGFTNLQLKNSYKDFSTFEYDTWGNVDYVDKAKISRYSGSVDVHIENYDMTDRLMTSLGHSLVILNGSDGINTETDSKTIFAATQKIGRFTSFDQRTIIHDDDMDVMANYTFTLEEIV